MFVPAPPMGLPAPRFRRRRVYVIGIHGRDMRPNSEPSSGSRGDYKPALISQEIVERELTKFIGEISNW